MAQGEELFRLVAREPGDEEAPVGIMLDDPFRTEQLQRLAHGHAAGVELFRKLGLAKPHARRESPPRDQRSQLVRYLCRNPLARFCGCFHMALSFGADCPAWQSPNSHHATCVHPVASGRHMRVWLTKV